MKTKDAPKIVNVGVWSATIIGVLAFSISLGAYFFGTMNNQISADTTTQINEPKTNCPAGSIMYTINNYPGPDLSYGDGSHAKYYLEGDKNWRCSYVCVPEGQALAKYLDGATIDGKKVKTVENSAEFNALVDSDKETAMTVAVILDKSSSDRRCAGNSKNYGEIINGEEKIDTLERKETVYVEPETSTEDALMGGGTIAGRADSDKNVLDAPVGSGSSGGSENDSPEISTNDATKQCKARINRFLIDYKGQQGNEERLDDYYYLVYWDYITLKAKSPIALKQTEFEMCSNIEKEIAEYMAEDKKVRTDVCIENLKLAAQRTNNDKLANTINTSLYGIIGNRDLTACNVLLEAFRRDSTQPQTSQQPVITQDTKREFTFIAHVGYKGKFPSNVISEIKVYTPGPGGRGKTLVSEGTCKGGERQCQFKIDFSQDYRDGFPDEILVYAVTHGGFLGGTRYNAKVIRFNLGKAIQSLDIDMKHSPVKTRRINLTGSTYFDHIFYMPFGK